MPDDANEASDEISWYPLFLRNFQSKSVTAVNSILGYIYPSNNSQGATTGLESMPSSLSGDKPEDVESGNNSAN